RRQDRQFRAGEVRLGGRSRRQQGRALATARWPISRSLRSNHSSRLISLCDTAWLAGIRCPMKEFTLRDPDDADFAAVVALNAAEVRRTSPMDEARLRHL